MSPDDLMPVGECCVCGEYLDFTDMGNCGTCDQPFHWGRCGGWEGAGHMCNNCKEEEPDNEEV